MTTDWIYADTFKIEEDTRVSINVNLRMVAYSWISCVSNKALLLKVVSMLEYRIALF